MSCECARRQYCVACSVALASIRLHEFDGMNLGSAETSVGMTLQQLEQLTWRPAFDASQRQMRMKRPRFTKEAERFQRGL